MIKVKFDVIGMTCSSCSLHVEKAVRKVGGVKKVEVNLLSNNMVVEFDDNISTNNDIINAVINAGYSATVSDGHNNRLDNKEENKDHKKEKSNNLFDDSMASMKRRLIISFCCLIPLMYVAMHNMLSKHFGIPVPQIISGMLDGPQNAMNFAFTQFLLLLPIIYVNRSYFSNGFKRLIKRAPSMDSLIAIGSGASTIYGVYTLYMIGNALGNNQLEVAEEFASNLYFESAGTILTLITFGKYLETKSKRKTTAAVEKLMNLAPKTATIEKDEKQIEISTSDIKVGDTIIIKPGSNIPVDGKVIYGEASIDQSSITGESMPVDKTVGDNVTSGTINKNGFLKIEATKVGSDTTLSQIIKIVEEAGNSKAPISKIADKVSGVFVPLVIIIAILATIFWLMNGQSFEFALNIGISVLVISCPCALGLATPVAIMVGMGKGASMGVLIKSAEILEMLHSVDTVVLDKTGTITEGKPKIIDAVLMPNQEQNDEEEFLKLLASLEQSSEHPLAQAIVEKSKEKNIRLQEGFDFKSVLGKGVSGEINGKKYFAGNEKFICENGVDLSVQVENEINLISKRDKYLEEGKTILYFATQDVLLGFVVIADTIKQTSYDAIKMLKNKKLDIVMLTGDNKVVAKSIGDEIGIKNIVAEVLPQDKEKEVSKIQKEGKKVAFIGDGINDSPALAKADVGIAIGSGTDIALESADIVLKNDDLTSVSTAIDLSTAVMRNIKINLFWAFFYNVIGIPIAAGVFYLSHGFKLNPMIGAAAMSLSSVCVVANALTLNLFNGKNNKSTNYCTCDKKRKEEINMIKKVSIDGMQCNHCKMTVEKVLTAIDGVEKVEVDLSKKQATVELAKEIEDKKIKEVIEEAGFTVVEII